MQISKMDKGSEPDEKQHGVNGCIDEPIVEFDATVRIGYVHLAALGGLRNRSSKADTLLWENLSFRNYADYAMTQEFHRV